MKAAAFLVALLALPSRGAGRPEVLLDPRVELAAALHLLAAPGKSAKGFRSGGAYADALTRGLAEVSEHPAVAMYARSLSRPSVGGQAFMTPLREIVGCLDDALLLDARDEECRRSGLAHAAADFAARARFPERLPALRRLVAPALASLAKERDAADLPGLFEEYTGAKTGPHRVAASPTLATGQVWNGMFRRGSSYRVVTVIAPVSARGAALRFDWRPVMRDVWHEHGHALLDPVVEAGSVAVRASEGLFASTKGGCYDEWTQCVREHLAQGLSLRVLAWARAGKRVRRPADEALNARLPWQAELAAVLGEYETRRAEWPRLELFAPRLLDFFRARAAREGLRPPAFRRALPVEEDADARRGVDLFAAGRAADAAAAFEASVRRGGGAASLLSLGVALEAAGRGADAGKVLDRAVEAARRDARLPPEVLADALSTRAQARVRAGDSAGARRDLEEALVCAPMEWPRRDDAARRLAGSPPLR